MRSNFLQTFFSRFSALSYLNSGWTKTNRKMVWSGRSVEAYEPGNVQLIFETVSFESLDPCASLSFVVISYTYCDPLLCRLPIVFCQINILKIPSFLQQFLKDLTKNPSTLGTAQWESVHVCKNVLFVQRFIQRDLLNSECSNALHCCLYVRCMVIHVLPSAAG